MANMPTGRASVQRPDNMMLRRTRMIFLVCGIVAFLLLGFRLFWIMVVQHDEYEEQAVRQTVVRQNVLGLRGTIYDANGKILAKSATKDTVILSPADIKKNNQDLDGIARVLSENLADYGVTYEQIIELARDTDSYYKIVARKVDREDTDPIREYKNSITGGVNGIVLSPDSKRYYPYGSLAAHVLGYVGIDNDGLAGVESQYDNVLAGGVGRITRLRDKTQIGMLNVKYEDYTQETAGADVKLTLDANIQYYLEKHLKQAVEDYDIQNGAASIAMDPNTGAILGMVSLGNFDPNDYQILSDEAEEELALAEEEEHLTKTELSELRTAALFKQWRNKALSDTYEPGSTFKIITLAMGLDSGVIDLNSSFYCGGSTTVIGRTTPLNCWKTDGSHADQTLTQAVQHSCNVAFAQIGELVGARTFYKYCDAFGFLELTDDNEATLSAKTGIDLAGESGSIWWSEKTFYNPENHSQLASASFGQTFNVTPVQMITAISACVNGGYLMKPYIVQEITDATGRIVASNEPTVVRQVVSEETSATVREILEKVVGDPVDGTGKNAYVAGYKIGGKTGTSEKVAQDAAGGPKEYIVSFVGVAPADDPKIVILTLLDTPSDETGIYISGGQMGAPTVGKMMADILPYLGVDPVYTAEEKANMDETVPSLTGMDVNEAVSLLEQRGFNARIIGEEGKVSHQLPGTGATIANGSTVLLYAGEEPSEEQEEMIDLSYLTYNDARDYLAAMGLFVSTSSSVTSPSTQAVLAQSIPEGTLVDHGTVIEVTLVTGDQSMLGMY